MRTDDHLYDELKRLKKEVAQLTEERNLLLRALGVKKAAAYPSASLRTGFAKEQLSTAGMQEVGQRRSSCRDLRMDKATK